MIINGDARKTPLADNSIHCIVTSPPYYGLRDYGTAKWVGGSPDCKHEQKRGGSGAASAKQNRSAGTQLYQYAGFCPLCGAVRIDDQIGQEQAVSEYVDNLVQCAREWWRVLRDDGSLWLNLGDSYAGSGRGAMGDGTPSDRGGAKQGTNKGTVTGRFIKPARDEAKPKDLYGMPWTVALALRADGWYLRRDVIWFKKNPMPESVTDRPTTAHEYIFLLTKEPRYFYDADAVAEPAAYQVEPTRKTSGAYSTGSGRNDGSTHRSGGFVTGETRNLRSVWNIAAQPYSGAHFATMPPEIARRAILAGTSARGCCPQCLTPYERQVARRRLRRDESPASDARYRPNRYAGAYESINGKGDAGYTETETIGWEPTCKCNAGEPIPCTVLDPFAGSGTTLKVALELGRRAVGVELNPQYIRLAEERLADVTYGLPL